MNPSSSADMTAADMTAYGASVDENSSDANNKGYAPSVPLSVYRELSTELQTAKVRVDALNRQNKQLSRQNQALRHEIQRFVQSAEQLGHFAGVLPAEAAGKADRADLEAEIDRTDAIPMAMVSLPEDRPQPLAAPRNRPETAPTRKPRLFTEQPERPRRVSQGPSRPQDLSNLWLATTILLVIFTAFGAGFLIMRPLLKR
ncbi:MAG: hypothetical protein O3A14_03750 [Cyanobacteria bacterium]|nr:hypothetical protein [Cyanobacteriota bacterium]